ncbi:SRPBCC family protein [Olleya sp. YS]|uniref:aromatic ring-hydroxylating oxygenase subunit alpha n=1 Tax=Olleya sp. YS TaxID=3028318 RepID=UPI0024342DF9|nr:SRPBCC family protein [Olleya sp. YS]WGD35960.1 SRPBCC family protein [Olleya sp. YS]
MNQERQIATIKTVFENLEKQKNKTDADGITHSIETSRYHSNKRFKKEQKQIFQNHPIITGAVGDLKKEGDYFLHEDSGIPIIVIKGKDGIVRAFINMCRHRGVKLLEEQKGHIKRNIVCPYHAWSYDTAGCLKGVFHPQGFNDVSETTHSLIELDCWVRFGMVFVLPNSELKGSIDIDKWLTEINELTKGFEFGELYPYFHKSEILNCNWKLIVDGALEGYHFKIAHANTIGPYFLDNLSVNTENELHHSIIFPKRIMKEFQSKPTSEWNLRQGANILIHIFPNTIILIEPDHIMAVTFCPLDEKTTQFKSFMLLPKEPTTEKETKYWDLNGNIFWNAINEDNEMAILQQKTFEFYNSVPMTTGSYEKLLVKFESLVDSILEKSKD